MFLDKLQVQKRSIAPGIDVLDQQFWKISGKHFKEIWVSRRREIARVKEDSSAKMISLIGLFKNLLFPAYSLNIQETFENPYKATIAKASLLKLLKDGLYSLSSAVKLYFLGKILRKPSIETSILRDIKSIFGVPFSNLDLPTVSWWGHSSCMLRAFGVTVMTDPVWSDKVGPPLFKLVRNSSKPPELDCLHRADIVLVSHNHCDHFDMNTLELIKKLNPKLKLLSPKEWPWNLCRLI